MVGGDLSEIVLLTAFDEAHCARALNHLGQQKCKVVKDEQSLALAKGHILVSFGSSIIVPSHILKKYPGGAYNIHAASPEYPGRDPHHWAVYDGVTRYGATAHIMTNKVDDGPIVDVEWFNVGAHVRPLDLLHQANEAAFKILDRIGPKLLRKDILAPLPNVHWGKNKKGRAHFLEMCKISPSISPTEFEKIYHAFDGGAHDNLIIELHGYTFRIEKRS